MIILCVCAFPSISDRGAIRLHFVLQLFDSVLLTQSQGQGGGSGKKTEETLLEIASDILSKVGCHWISQI